jgi:hypothetical protein
MFYKVWDVTGKGNIKDFTNFMADSQARVVEYNYTGMVVNFIIYETADFIDDDIFDKYGLTYIYLPPSYVPSKRE